MSIQQIQEWLDAICNTQTGVANGIVTEAGSAQAAARWTRGGAGDASALLRAAQSAVRARQAIVENMPLGAAQGSATPRIVALPLMRGIEATGAVALLFHDISAGAVDHAVDSLGKACAELMASLDASAPDAAGTAADTVLQIQAAVLSQARADEAAAVFATRLAQWLTFDRVSVGLVEKGYARVIATSHGAAVDAQQEQNRLIAAAMDEAIDQGATICVPAAAAAPRITLAHAALRRSGSGLACSIPIVHLGSIAGAVTLERTAEQPLSREALERCEHVVSLAGPLLALRAESELSAAARVRRSLAQQWRRLRDPRELPFKLALAGGILLLLFVLFVPLPYSVSAVTRLEGSVQRALVAASDGFIQQIAARPGDKVKQGQVLAELAQQDLQLERSKRGSELAQHVNAYSTAFARADRALLMVSQAKMDEARAQLELVESQLERTQVKAPFDGVVISGDLTQQLGAPIQRGAVLMVVAPADGYRLIVEVDERDINDVKAGAAGRVALAAMPGTTHGFHIERVTPLAATREGRHFFEVEGKLDASSAALRPGLQGVARIDAEARPLASMVFGRLVNWLRLRLWSWGWWA
jgi:biotin carboxyl carrier protein